MGQIIQRKESAINNEILIFETQGKQIEVQLDSQHETLWLSQREIVSVLGTEVLAIGTHVRNILKDKGLEAGATVSKYATVQTEGNLTKPQLSQTLR